MPKPFLLGIEVEEIALGTVLRKLNDMPGVVALHMDFDKKSKPKASDEGAPKQRTPGIPRTHLRDQLLTILAGAGPEGVAVADLVRQIGAGRKGSVYQVMHHLLQENRVRRPEVGRYALAGPVTSETELTPAMSKVLALFEKQQTISRGDVRTALKADKNKADWQIKMLVQKGFLKKTAARGVFERAQLVNGA